MAAELASSAAAAVRTFGPEANGGAALPVLQLSSFPIALSVEVARVSVALRDLAGLAPGGVLPLNVARDGRVTLRAGEVAVGRGELVEVDGALAVRIAAWEGCK